MNETHKNPNAVALGRLGGRAGSGQSKARPLTTEQARERVAVRWNKVKGSKPSVNDTNAPQIHREGV